MGLFILYIGNSDTKKIIKISIADGMKMHQRRSKIPQVFVIGLVYCKTKCRADHNTRPIPGRGRGKTEVLEKNGLYLYRSFKSLRKFHTTSKKKNEF